MPSSLSDAQNGGGDYVFRWLGGTSGPNPTVSYQLVQNAIPYAYSTGWTLAAATADLTGDGLPDLYIANDFGPGHLLYNQSTPGAPQVLHRWPGLARRDQCQSRSFLVVHFLQGHGSRFRVI